MPQRDTKCPIRKSHNTSISLTKNIYSLCSGMIYNSRPPGGHCNLFKRVSYHHLDIYPTNTGGWVCYGIGMELLLCTST